MSLRRVSFVPVPVGAYTPVGAMTSQVTFYNPAVQNVDSSFDAPSVFCQSWAKIAALQVKELYKSQEIVQEVTHLVTVPFIPGLNEDMTIGFENRTFVIEGIDDPDERHVEQRCLCREMDQNA